jgi:hypothetical protein
MSQPGHPDVNIENHGTLFLFRLNTPEVKAWVEENVQVESHQWFGGALAVEHRYAESLAQGILDAGFSCK